MHLLCLAFYNSSTVSVCRSHKGQSLGKEIPPHFVGNCPPDGSFCAAGGKEFVCGLVREWHSPPHTPFQSPQSVTEAGCDPQIFASATGCLLYVASIIDDVSVGQ